VAAVDSVRVAGLLLAAGAGRRMGGPKALLRYPDGEAWVARAARILAEGGCHPVLVVLGASAEQVRPLVPDLARVLVAADWAEGMGASLGHGLTGLLGQPEAGQLEAGQLEAGPDGATERPVAALIGLVDTPGVTAAVVARMLAEATGPQVLARAGYAGVPGHPVLIGADHWRAAAEQATGDAGARGYLAGRPVTVVECGDLGSGEDVDRPPGQAGYS
jgi:CTP:molybdopterin cytidylyltransferase MocA